MDVAKRIELFRERYLPTLNSHSREELSEKNKIIFERLFALPEYQNAKSIMVYRPFPCEVNVEEILPKIFTEKRMGVPFMDNAKDELKIAYVKDIDELKWGEFEAYQHPRHILEIVEPEKFDLILVPGMAFSSHGERIGVGNHYATLLQKACEKNPDFKKKCVTLAYEHQIFSKIPHAENCHSVGKIVTESRIIETLGK